MTAINEIVTMAANIALALSLIVALVFGQHVHTAAQEHHVHAGVRAGQRDEAVRRHFLGEPEVPGQEPRGGGNVVDIQLYR